MQGNHIPPIRRTKPKPPSVAVEQVSAVVQKWAGRWENAAVCRGSRDPSAHIHAAKSLQQLAQSLGQHRSTCKHGAVRSLLQKHMAPELFLGLLDSEHADVISLTLSAVHDLACIVPNVIPIEAAPRLLQLLSDKHHGGLAARVLTAQLSHWRFSQLWPHWTAMGTTAKVFQQLQQLRTMSQESQTLNAGAASKAVDGCVAMVTLLAKLMTLSEQQMLPQLAPDVSTASRWLHLLLQLGKRQCLFAGSPAFLQLQDSCCALLAALSRAPATSLALAASIPLRHKWLQLLHGVLHRPCCVSEADAGHIQCWMHAAAAASLPVLWQPPQHVEQHLQQQHGGLAAHEEHQLLADIAIAAAATLCNECFSTSSTAKQVDGAAAALLAAALLPHDGIYGSQRSCISRFTAAVLGSSCCHVLLHALAVSSNAGSSQTALMLAAAAAATPAAAAVAAAAQPSGAVSAAAPGAGEPAGQTMSAGSTAAEPEALVLAAVQQELQLEWLLLRMVCAQCVAASASAAEASRPDGSRSSTPHFGMPAAAGQNNASSSSSSRGARQHSRQQVALLNMASSTRNGSVVQPDQVLRVVQAYSGHDTHAADSHRVAGVLRSLHFLMCQSALALQQGPMHQKLQGQQPHQQDPATQRQREQERRQQQRERLQWLDLTSDGASSSCSSASETDAVQLSSGGKQLLQTAAGILELINGSIADSTVPAGRDGTVSQVSNNSSNGNSGGNSTSSSMHQLSWELVATVYVSLAITVYLQETATPTRAEAGAATVPAQCLSVADCCLAVTALQLAAGALKLLLPVVLVHTPAAAASAVQEQQQQQQQQQQQGQRHVVLPVHEALTCSLATVQAVATLSSLIQPALPALLAECISSSVSGSAVLSCSNSKPGSACGNGGAVKLSAARSALAAAAAALDSELQQLLSQVVLSWQAAPASDTSNGNSTNSSSTSNLPGASGLQLSVHVALQQQLQQELRCWSATALASCYGQLGARTRQGAVLEAFRGPEAPFADVQLQLGDDSTAMPAHAAILAAGCSVFRQQLFSAAAAVAGEAGTNGSCSDSLLLLKLSAAVDEQALQQALNFIYTGAAILEQSGLGYQLQLCSSCLSQGASPGSRQLQQQKLMALQHQQLQELRDLQQTAKQQLQKLGMLARKLQLPLLAALTRSRKLQPGQRLPDLHVSFAALLPQQMLTPGDVPWVPKAAKGPGRQEHELLYDARSQVTNGQQVLKVADAVADGKQQQPEQLQDQGQVTGHVSSTAYLSMLAAWSSEGTCAGTHLSIPAGDAAAGVQASAASPVAVQQVGHALLVAGSFADVFLAAPVLQAAQPSASVDSSTDEAPRDQSDQQAGSSPLMQRPQQQQQLLCGYFPAHRVMLSACCPYFEALLSQRWRHDDIPQHLHGQSGQQQDTSAPSAQQVACRPVRVVTVPEADAHVAAALLHYLYTGSIAVNPPAATALGPSPTAAPAAAVTAAALNGCCRACHEARTLLRLWRCAELLLLPGLQRLCIAAVDAAAWQLSSSCCLALLADCCHLGVPAAADGVIAALTQTADRDTTIALSEWSELPAGLQGVLIKAWAHRRRDQPADAEEAFDGPSPAPGTVLAAPPAAAGLGAAAQGGSMLVGTCGNGLAPAAAAFVGPASLCGSVGVVPVQGSASAPSQVLPGGACEVVVVPWGHLVSLREAAQSLCSAVGMHLQVSRG